MIKTMDTCFQCGGRLKLIAKLGRMALGSEEEETYYEIPAELRISTCLVCGWMFEEDVLMKVQRSCDAQRNCKPSFRLNMLRYVDQCLRNIIKRPAMYGQQESVESQILCLLNVRQAVLEKGLPISQRKVYDAYYAFLKERYPKMGNNAQYVHSFDLKNELTPVLSEFCDVFINAVV